MEDLFYTLTFKKVLLFSTIVIYAFVITTVLIKLLHKSNVLDDLPEADGSDVEQIFGVHAFNQNQQGDDGQDEGWDEDTEGYASMMEERKNKVMEEMDDDSDDPD
jgi:hypothetical protein